MFLTSLLFSVITLNPAIAPRATAFTEGFIQGQTVAGETTCKPGHICAYKKTTLHGCFVVNFYNGTNGGTPLAIDMTQTGANGTTTWVYWVNNYYKDIAITGNATAKFYCPYY